MASFHSGQLVTVKRDGKPVDGIVFATPGIPRIVVAVPGADGTGGEFLTAHFTSVKARTQKAPGDAALRELISATPAPSARTRPGAGDRTPRGLSGHAPAAPHRTTGR